MFVCLFATSFLALAKNAIGVASEELGVASGETGGARERIGAANPRQMKFCQNEVLPNEVHQIRFCRMKFAK